MNYVYGTAGKKPRMINAAGTDSSADAT